MATFLYAQFPHCKDELAKFTEQSALMLAFIGHQALLVSLTFDFVLDDSLLKGPGAMSSP